MNMALRRVDLSTDVYFVCLNHAMCTEGEEIVGLLVGEVDEERVAHVVAVLILRRSDKRKDRVEISPEQLSNASTEAEKLACILKRPVRVVGWYHSHPKLTVYPSLVDVCTQESYQLMDEGFIGMIFSVFNTDPNKFGGRIQMICYQSQTVIIDCNVEKSHVEIPIQLVPSSYISDVCMNSVVQLPRFLCQEEQLAYQMANQVPLDYLTRLHNSSVYLRKMGQIAEVICGPLLKMLEERILNNEMKRKRLQERKKALTVMVQKARKEKLEKEEEMKEKAKKEQETQEKVLKEQEDQEKAQIGDQDLDALLEEQELRAALLKDQEMRAKARQAQSQGQEVLPTDVQHDSQIVNQDIQVGDHVEVQGIQEEPQLKGDEIGGLSQIGDQEVPQLREQENLLTEDQIMQEELELEEQEWQAQLDEQEWQELNRQKIEQITNLQLQAMHQMALLRQQEILQKQLQAASESALKLRIAREEAQLKEQQMKELKQPREQKSANIQIVQENNLVSEKQVQEKVQAIEQNLCDQSKLKTKIMQKKPQLPIQEVHAQQASQVIKSPTSPEPVDITQEYKTAVELSKCNAIVESKVPNDHKLESDNQDKSITSDLSEQKNKIVLDADNIRLKSNSPPKVQNTSEMVSLEKELISKNSPPCDPDH